MRLTGKFAPQSCCDYPGCFDTLDCMGKSTDPPPDESESTSEPDYVDEVRMVRRPADTHRGVSHKTPGYESDNYFSEDGSMRGPSVSRALTDEELADMRAPATPTTEAGGAEEDRHDQSPVSLHDLDWRTQIFAVVLESMVKVAERGAEWAIHHPEEVKAGFVRVYTAGRTVGRWAKQKVFGSRRRTVQQLPVAAKIATVPSEELATQEPAPVISESQAQELQDFIRAAEQAAEEAKRFLAIAHVVDDDDPIATVEQPKQPALEDGRPNADNAPLLLWMLDLVAMRRSEAPSLLPQLLPETATDPDPQAS